MAKTYKIIFIMIFIILFSGCTPKLTVKALQPAKITSEKINNIEIERFGNDFINQTQAIEEKISTRIIDGKKVFSITPNANTILTGEVLRSTLDYTIYYEHKIDYGRCRVFRIDEKTKKKTCLEYYSRLIPCEDREYYVATKVRVLKPDTNRILFTKTYDKSRNIRQCFDYYYYPYHSFSRDKREINTRLAQQIANEIIDDISPHYKYYDLEIIDSFDNKNLKITDKQKESFEKAAKLIENRKFITATELLEALDNQLKSKSWEVLYNLGLIQEAQDNLFNAKTHYENAKVNVTEVDELELINNSISRTQRNLEEKIKAKSQLP